MIDGQERCVITERSIRGQLRGCTGHSPADADRWSTESYWTGRPIDKANRLMTCSAC
jgi:hypothetical protein